MTNGILEGTHGRLIWLTKGYVELYKARNQLTEASDTLRHTNAADESYPAEVHALEQLTDATLRRVKEIAYRVASQLGWQVATFEIAPIARESGEQAVTFITGNSMMPPLRELEYASAVWNLDEPDLWEAFVEGVENRLDELRVHLGAPEYDNALYVVDLARFEYAHHELGHDDDSEDDSLESEWRPISD